MYRERERDTDHKPRELLTCCPDVHGSTPRRTRERVHERALQSISEIPFCLGRDPGTLKSDIVSKKHPQLICSDLRLSN